MTRTEAKAFHEELDRMMTSLYRKYHLIVRKSNLTFGNREISLSIKCEQTEKDGTHKADPILEHRLKSIFESLGYKKLPTTFIGAEFLAFNGKRYTITGFNSKAPKYPIEIEDEFGKRFRSTGKGYKFMC